MILHLSRSLWSYLSPCTALKRLAGAATLVLGGGGIREGKGLLCAGHKPQPQFSWASQGRGGETRSEGGNINLGGTRERWEKEFPLCFSRYLTIFPKADSVLPIMVIVKCLYLKPWAFPSYSLPCAVEEGKIKGGRVGSWPMSIPPCTMTTHKPQSIRENLQPCLIWVTTCANT